MDKEKRNIIIVKQLEFLFWLIILLIIISLVSGFNIYNKKRTDDYTVFMQDIDGLIVGSPVRMLGIEVGYITKIKPHNSEVIVNFVINNKDIVIPQGSNVIVEFSGLGGSKSLEIYPPKESKNITEHTPLIQALPPRRLSDSLSMLNEMIDKLSTIISTATVFGDKLQNIDYNNNDRNNLLHLINISDNLMKNSKIKE